MIEKIKSIYMIGVGGISMSALARFLHFRGITVYGSDIVVNDEVRRLLQDGIIKFQKGSVHSFVRLCDAVCYTGAVASDNSDLNLAKKLNKIIVSRAQLLGELAKDKKTISIAGTHGKTTTTALIATTLLVNQLNPNVHIGGVLNNINSNVNISQSDLFVTEACEYKDSFLSLNSNICVVLNIKPDHLDYFKNFDNEFASFQKFVDNADKNGYIVLNNDDKYCRKLKISSKRLTFAIDSDADVKAVNIKKVKGKISFDVLKNGCRPGRIYMPCYGYHNIYNTLATICVCLALNIPFVKIKKGIERYKGVARRFEILSQNRNRLLLHDYAHHPDEIRAILNLCKDLSYKKLITIFQPHTYSRTRDLYDEFLSCFDDSDEVWLLPIYPAREKPIKGVTSYKLKMDLAKRGKKAKYFNNFQKCYEEIVKNNDKSIIFAILGAGDIVELANMFKKSN